jgi:hypothetical protein
MAFRCMPDASIACLIAISALFTAGPEGRTRGCENALVATTINRRSFRMFV